MASPFLAGFPGGLMEGQQFAQQQELRRLQLQQALQEQQTLGAIGQTLRQNPNFQIGGFPGGLSGALPQPTGYQAGVGQDIATSLAGGPPQSGGGPASGMVRGLPAPSGAVRGSWFGNAPGWSDPSDSGLQASGVPVSAGPGIALPSRATLGQQFDVTAPSGQTYTLPQTDVGPAKWTGRGVDINAPAAQAMGYTPKTFPTDQQFIVKAHNQLDGEVGRGGIKLVQGGMPAAAVQASTQTAQTAGRLINPQLWGRSQLPDIFAAVDKANPNAPDAVKVLAALQLNKVAAPEERMALQMWAKQNAQELQLGLAQFRAATAEERLREGQGSISGIFQSGGQTYGVTRGGQTKLLDLPADAAKIGTKPPGGGVSDLQAEWVANYIEKTGTWPVGSGRNQALQNKVEQILGARGVDPAKVAQAAGAFKADQTSLSAAQKLADATSSYEKTALKNLDLATEQIHKAAPTNFGPFINKWLETGETFAGDTTVPKSVAAVITLANEYAKVMSGSTGAQAATDSSRREAAEILNPYFSSGQWDEVGSLIKQEMNNRITSLYDQVDIIQTRMGRGAAPATRPQSGAPPPIGSAASPYAAPEDVEKAFMAGKLTKEQAQKILVDQFGAK